MLTTQRLFSLEYTLLGPWLGQYEYPWLALPSLREAILSQGARLGHDDYEQIAPDVWIHRSARVAVSAFIGGCVIIGPGAEIRHCAYIRGDAVIGAGCVVGNSTEIKHSILFDGAQAPHFNYVGDSILGHRAHLGAGAITSNVRSDKHDVIIHAGDEHMATGLVKCGAMLGDDVEVGCNSVLNPGTVVGKGSIIYPLSSVRGTVPEHAIWKRQGDIAVRMP